jgi:hypothetical protein
MRSPQRATGRGKTDDLRSPQRVSKSPQRVSKSPQHVSKSPQRATGLLVYLLVVSNREGVGQ